MDIFRIILICVGFGFFISKNDDTKKNKAIFILFTIFIIVVVAFKDIYSIGVDIYRYSKHYDTIKQMSLEQVINHYDSSQLYYCLNWICGRLNLEFKSFVALLSTFIVSVYSWYLYKYSKSPFLSYLICMGMGCFTFIFSGLKQSLAMAIVLIAIDQFMQKKHAQMIVIFIIAFFIHPTSIVLLPYFIIANRKIDSKLILGYFIALLLSIIFRMQLGAFLTKLFDDDYLDRYTSGKAIGGTFILILSIAILYLWVNKKSILTPGSEQCKLFHSLIITLIIQVCSSYAYSFTRLNLYNMMSFITIIVPNLLYSDDVKERFEKNIIIYRGLFIICFSTVMISLFFGYVKSDQLESFRFIWE